MKVSPKDPEPKRYWAFISYSSKDRKEGEWLQRRLERYPIPQDLRGTEIMDGEILGKFLRPVFRDRDELSGSAHLGPAIHAALRASRFLIVLCSPNSARSAWVNKEILDFMSLRPENPDRILALILSGEPNASSNPAFSDDLECMPPALRYPAEPLAGDLRPEGDGRERGFLKILSGIVQLDFDKLHRRHERYMRRRRAIAGSIAGVLILSLSGLTAFALLQRGEAIRQRAETQKAMSTGFLRSLGQSRGGNISGAEEAALYELAAVPETDVAVREEFIRRLFAEPEYCRRLVARSGLIVHAAVGFNTALSAQLSEKARSILKAEKSSQLQREAALLTLVHLARNSGDLSLTCSEMVASIASQQSTYHLALAAEMAESMPVRPSGEDAREVARAAANRIREGSGDQNHLARILVALAPSLDAEAADETVAALVEIMLGESGRLDPLGAAVASLSPRLSPERRSHHSGVLADMLLKEPDANQVNAAGAAFNALAPSLPPTEAGALAGRIAASLPASARGALHGLLAVAALSALDLTGTELPENLTLQLLELWTGNEAPLHTAPAMLGLERLLEKADAAQKARIVGHLMGRFSAPASPLRSHSVAVVGMIDKHAGSGSLAPFLDTLLDLHIGATDYTERVSSMGMLLKIIREAEIPNQEEAFGKLRSAAPRIGDESMRELLLEVLSESSAENRLATEARFSAAIASLLDPDYGRPPSAPTGLRVLSSGRPTGLSGWSLRLARSSGDLDYTRSWLQDYNPDKHMELRGMLPSLEARTVDEARLKLLSAFPGIVELRVACRMASALLVLAPPSANGEADRIAGHLLRLIAEKEGNRSFYETIPIFKELVPYLGEAMLERTTDLLLGIARDGYPPECEPVLREALIAAGKRQGAETVIINLLAALYGKSQDVLSQWLAPIVGTLSTGELHNLIKSPFCVGESGKLCKAILLERLGQTGATGGRALDTKELLRLAGAAGYDMESPWQRKVR